MSTNHLRDNGRAVLLSSALSSMPQGTPFDASTQWIGEIGQDVFIRAHLTPIHAHRVGIEVVFDGDRARARAFYDPNSKTLTLRPDDFDNWATHQRRAADWLNSQLLRLHKPDWLRIEGVA